MDWAQKDLPLSAVVTQCKSDNHNNISGDVTMTTMKGAYEDAKKYVHKGDLKRQKKTYRAFLAAFRAGCIDLLDRCGVDTDSYKWNGAKLLQAKKGKGQQALHWDSGKWSAHPGISCLLYLSDGEYSARFPRGAHDDIHPRYRAEKIRPNAWQLMEDFFHSVPVEVGTIVVFKHSVPHGGSAARGKERIVLFDELSWRKKVPNKERDRQYFIWNWARDVFGRNSEEEMALIERHQKLVGCDPLRHEEKEDKERILKELQRRAANRPVSAAADLDD